VCVVNLNLIFSAEGIFKDILMEGFLFLHRFWKFNRGCALRPIDIV